jgi:hypothetical protein
MNKTLKTNGKNISVKVIAITANGLLISIPEGDFFLSYGDYPWFRNARVDEVLDVEMESNNAIRCDNLDVDLEIESILHPEKYPVIMSNLL